MILLTGASGYIGTEVLQHLLSDGQDVIAITQSQSLKPHPNLRTVTLNLLSEGVHEVIRKYRPHTCLHLAWYAEHGKYWNSPLNFSWQTASMQLAHRFYEEGGAYFLSAGTCAEYDWAQGFHREDSPERKAHTIYGECKRLTGLALANLATYFGKTHCHARLFLPYGGRDASTRLIPSLIQGLKGARPAFSVNGEGYRDFMHVNDMARALVHLSAMKQVGTVNICSGTAVRIHDIVLELSSQLRSSPVQFQELYGIRDGDPKFLIGDNSRLMHSGFLPRYSLSKGLEEAIRRSDSEDA